MGLVAVSAHAAGLVGVAGLGVHRGDHPARSHPPRDTPAARHLGIGLDVLARHHPQQPHGVGLVVCEVEALDRGEHRASVCDQFVDQPGPLPGIRPITPRLGTAVVVVGQLQRRRLADEAAAAPDRGGDHRVGVLRRHRVEQHRGIQRPAAAL